MTIFQLEIVGMHIYYFYFTEENPSMELVVKAINYYFGTEHPFLAHHKEECLRLFYAGRYTISTQKVWNNDHQ